MTKISFCTLVLGREDMKRICSPSLGHDGALLHQLVGGSPAHPQERVFLWPIPDPIIRLAKGLPFGGHPEFLEIGFTALYGRFAVRSREGTLAVRVLGLILDQKSCFAAAVLSGFFAARAGRSRTPCDRLPGTSDDRVRVDREKRMSHSSQQ